MSRMKVARVEAGSREFLGTVVGRLNRILRSKFQSELSYDTLPALKVPPHMIQFPITSGTRLMGFALIKPQRPLNDGEIARVKFLVQIVMGSFLRAQRKLQHLDQWEGHLVSHVEPPANVKPLNRAAPKSEAPLEVTATSNNNSQLRPEWKISIPCLIHSQSAADIHKAALELHQMSHRLSFVSMSDLASENFKTASDIEAMGSITLFVSDLSALKSAQQAALLEYLRLPNRPHGPLILTGSLRSMPDLLEDSELLRELVQKVATAYLHLKEAFRTDLNRGIMEFFFRSVVQPYTH